MGSKRVYIYQNIKTERLINKIFGKPRFGDVILYNPDYGINKSKYYQIEFLPLPRKRDLIKYKKYPQNISWVISLDRVSEIKRNYIEKEYCSFFYHWLKDNIYFSGSVDLICFNKFCLVPVVMSTYLVEYPGTNAHLYEIEIDNSISNGYKIEKMCINQGWTESELYKSALYRGNSYRGVLKLVNSYIIKRNLLRCFITPKVSYLIDRFFGRVITRVLISFNIFKNWKKNDFDIGFACQISDDTSLPMPPDIYFDIIEGWINKFSNDYKCKLIIHPKERSLKSVLKYIYLARKYRISIIYGGLDKLARTEFNQNRSLKEIYYISSTSACKYKEIFNFKKMENYYVGK
jgi:hypothetical protein